MDQLLSSEDVTQVVDDDEDDDEDTEEGGEAKEGKGDDSEEEDEEEEAPRWSKQRISLSKGVDVDACLGAVLQVFVAHAFAHVEDQVTGEEHCKIGPWFYKSKKTAASPRPGDELAAAAAKDEAASKKGGGGGGASPEEVRRLRAKVKMLMAEVKDYEQRLGRKERELQAVLKAQQG